VQSLSPVPSAAGDSRIDPSVVILKSDDVVQFRARKLENLAVLECRHTVNGARGYLDGLVHRMPRDLAVDACLKKCSAARKLECLVLDAMVLKTQPAAGPQPENLHGIAVGEPEQQLRAPGLLNKSGLCAGSGPSGRARGVACT